jgi:hypothetical protein
LFKIYRSILQKREKNLSVDKLIYLSLIDFKSIKKRKVINKRFKEVNYNILNIKYEKYMTLVNKLNNVNYFYKNINAKKILLNNNLNMKLKNAKFIKFFNRKEVLNKMVELYGQYNIFSEQNKIVKSRYMLNNLLLPYYFFTAKYNEKNMPSQIKH